MSELPHEAEAIARIEVARRERNERGGWPVGGGLVEFRCECGYEACDTSVQLTLPEFTTVRANARRFAVLPGHEIPEMETVVERYDRYRVVEKPPQVDHVTARS